MAKHSKSLYESALDAVALGHGGGDNHYDPYAQLCAAVVERAVLDYERALRVRMRDGDDTPPHVDQMIWDCERFFANEIAMYSDLDGDFIKRTIEGRVFND